MLELLGRGARLGQLGHRAARGPGRSTSTTASPGSRSRPCASAAEIADIGSGAGFPGLVLAVALPDARVDLIESVGRKCEFIRRAIDAAGIANAEVVNARSEELAAGAGPRGLRRGHRPRRRPALDPRRARLAAARATAASWSPGRAGATRTRRRELERAAEALAMRAGGDPRRRPLRRQPPPPPPRDPQERRRRPPTCRAAPGMAKKRPRGSS